MKSSSRPRKINEVRELLRILIVEDNPSMKKLMKARLVQEGYLVLEADNGLKALTLLESEHVDLIISDLMMPVMDGFELIELLRSAGSQVPILVITAKESFEDKEKGFQVGTDDYMVKPIHMNEMILRVGALLRRAKIANERKLTFGRVVLDYDQLTVSIDQEVWELPKKEFYLLFKLLSYPKQIFTRQQLMDEIWGMETEVDERVVDNHIKKLRKRFDAYEDFKLMTIRGLGYKAERGL